MKYTLYELAPTIRKCACGKTIDHYRFIATFDNYDDARTVWDALAKTNILFNVYKIIEEES